MSADRQPRLWCTLKRSVVTEDADFIPEGTPVQVMCWDYEDEDDERPPTQIVVQANILMFNEFRDPQGYDLPPTVLDSTLEFVVDPDNLVYLRHEGRYGR